MCFDFASPRTAWIPVIFFQVSIVQLAVGSGYHANV
jgi:hypothetical protein